MLTLSPLSGSKVSGNAFSSSSPLLPARRVYQDLQEAQLCMYWDFAVGQFLAELVKQMALNNSLIQGGIPAHDREARSPEDPGAEYKSPDTGPAKPGVDHDESERNDNNPITKADKNMALEGLQGSSFEVSMVRLTCRLQMCKKPCNLP